MVDFTQISLSISIGTLAAVVYTLRMLVMLDKKLDKIIERRGI